MKKCPICGKEIPDEVNFCPYCMTKFLVRDDGKQEVNLPVKSKKTRNLIFIGILVVIIILLIVVTVLLKKDKAGEGNDVKAGSIGENSVNNESESESNSDNTISSDDSEKKNETFIPYYGKYLGIWNNNYVNGISVEENGGIKLNILSTDAEKIVFELLLYQQPPQSRVASINNINAVIVDGRAEFVFMDDGFGNEGKGYLEFRDNEIYVKTEITGESMSAMWKLSIDDVLTKEGEKADGTKCYFKNLVFEDISQMLIQKNMYNSFSKMKNTEETDAYTNEDGSVRINYEASIGVTGVFIDYRIMTKEEKNMYGYCEGVEYTSTYDDIRSNLGKIVWEDEVEGITETCYESREENSTYVKVGTKDNIICYIYYYYPVN